MDMYFVVVDIFPEKNYVANVLEIDKKAFYKH